MAEPLGVLPQDMQSQQRKVDEKTIKIWVLVNQETKRNEMKWKPYPQKLKFAHLSTCLTTVVAI